MAATNFQSDDSGGGGVIKNPRSPGHSQPVSSPWSTIVQGPPVMVSDAVSSAPVSVTPAPTFSSSVVEKIGNFTSDWSPPSMVPDVVSSPDDSGTDGQGSDSSGVSGSNTSKKPAWNKPNGAVEVVSPVMGAVSWPALGESTKASPKSSSSESLNALGDGPLLHSLQVTGNSSPLSHKQTSANTIHVAPSRQRSMKRGGGTSNSNPSPNGSVSHISTPNQDSDPSPRDKTQVESPRGNFGPQSHNSNNTNDHQQHQRGSYRRSNSGQHHNYGGKRDNQDRGNHEWNQQHSRSFNGRDNHNNHNHNHNHMQAQRGGYSRGYIRPSVHTSTPYMSVPVRPFANNMMYHDMSPVFYVQGPPPPPDALRAMPLVAPVPPPMFFAVPDPLLPGKIVTQIDYYFSNENLVKDTYLRQNMDEQGWVPVSLIAGFKKVLYLTDNLQLILDAMRASTKVEVQGNKMRRRNDWMNWLMNPAAHYLSSPRAVGQGSNEDSLGTKLETVVTLNDGVDHVGGQQAGQ
ncbi:hypothetical protein LXL04_007313 [Taraxacum kok-saghyz]